MVKQLDDKHNDFFVKQLFIAPQFRFLRHLILSVAIVSLTFLEMKDIYREGSRWFPVLKSSIICLSVIYLNVYVLAPQFLLKLRWYGVYLLSTFYIALLVYFIEIKLNDAVYLSYSTNIMVLYGKIEINPLLQIFTSVFSLIILMVSSSVVVLFRRWAIHEARVNDLEKTVIQSELEKLKKQVKPQFLVRLLDKANIQSVKGKWDEAAEILLQLGNVLRYQLYDSSREFVLLNSDIRFLTEILSLEQKCRNDFLFTVESDIHLHNYLIPPLLFLPFVEQVISANPDVPFINLRFRMDDDTLVFECQSIDTSSEYPEVELDAISRRLMLLYENRYSLKVNIGNDLQLICLRISLHEKQLISIAS